MGVPLASKRYAPFSLFLIFCLYFIVEFVTNYTNNRLERRLRSSESKNVCSEMSNSTCIYEATTNTFKHIVLDDSKVFYRSLKFNYHYKVLTRIDYLSFSGPPRSASLVLQFGWIKIMDFESFDIIYEC